MAVAALAAMGASHERIQAWARSYAARVGLRPADERERGGRRRWRERIARAGSTRTLADALATLADGMGAAAFHAVIRAAYALERDDDDEFAAALESWEREYLVLPIPGDIRRVSLEEALDALRRSGISGKGPGLIATRMEMVGAHEAFLEVARAVPAAGDLDALARSAAAAFARRGDFTALHVMTGTHALRVFRRYVYDADVDALMPAFWRAFAAAAIVSGDLPTLDADDLDDARSAAPAEWAPLLDEAVSHEDDHVIKATYTAWRLDLECSDPVFRAAAARYLSKLRMADRA